MVCRFGSEFIEVSLKTKKNKDDYYTLKEWIKTHLFIKQKLLEN